MNLQSPDEFESTPMDIDDDPQFSDYQHLPNDSLHSFVTTLPPSLAYHSWEPRYTDQNHQLAGQHGYAFSSSEPSTDAHWADPSRQRGYADGPPHAHTLGHVPTGADAFADSADSRRSRRTRSRLQGRPQDHEFPPLIYFDPTIEEEEAISAYHYPIVDNTSHSIQRVFDSENVGEDGPHIVQASPSGPPPLDGPEDHGECTERSDSADSFTQVARASVAERPRLSRLSTLSDICLPCPFERSSTSPIDNIKVHERGLDRPPYFHVPARVSTGQMGSHARVHQLEEDVHMESPESPSAPTNFFNKPLCESPEGIDRTHR